MKFFEVLVMPSIYDPTESRKIGIPFVKLRDMIGITSNRRQIQWGKFVGQECRKDHLKNLPR